MSWKLFGRKLFLIELRNTTENHYKFIRCPGWSSNRAPPNTDVERYRCTNLFDRAPYVRFYRVIRLLQWFKSKAVIFLYEKFEVVFEDFEGFKLHVDPFTCLQNACETWCPFHMSSVEQCATVYSAANRLNFQPLVTVSPHTFIALSVR
jgi:hypothetical protein